LGCWQPVPVSSAETIAEETATNVSRLTFASRIPIRLAFVSRRDAFTSIGNYFRRLWQFYRQEGWDASGWRLTKSQGPQ
jgi:hypothetical protein